MSGAIHLFPSYAFTPHTGQLQHISVKFSRAENRVKMWRFTAGLGTNSFPFCRVSGGLVGPELMTVQHCSVSISIRPCARKDATLHLNFLYFSQIFPQLHQKTCSNPCHKLVIFIKEISKNTMNCWWNGIIVLQLCGAMFLNRRAVAQYRALTSIIPGRERPEETTICYKISLVQLITNLNIILYLSTCHTVYISVLILFMIMP